MTTMRSLTALMRARETLSNISESLQVIGSDLHPEEVFSTGMLCSDLLALTEELFDEFEELFPDEYQLLGAPPEFERQIGPAEEIIADIASYFEYCQQYVAEIGALLPVVVDEQELEITDQDLWDLR